MKKLTLLLTLLFCASAFAQKNVAVLEIERRGATVREISREEGMEITGVIRSAAVNTLPRRQFSVMTSETVQAMGGAVLAECFDETCVIALGRTIDAEYVVRGVLSKFQTVFTLNIEMFETEYGNLVATSASVRSENLMEILSASELVSVEMFRNFLRTGTQTSAQQAQPTQRPPAPTVGLPPRSEPRRDTSQVAQQTTTRVSTPPPAQQQSQQVVRREPRPIVSPSSVVRGTFRDPRDRKTYGTVTIGNQTWMAENLNYNPAGGNSVCYDNRGSNCSIYGRLYDWETAMTACPTGWRLPNDEDWSILIDAVVGNSFSAGNKLKANRRWERTFGHTDEYGFSALPGGQRIRANNFSGIGYTGFWWTATEVNETNAQSRRMQHDFAHVGSAISVEKRRGFSVRCIMDN